MLAGLGPHHTREGFRTVRLDTRISSPDEFVVAPTGRWLLPRTLSIASLDKARQKVADAGRTKIANAEQAELQKAKFSALEASLAKVAVSDLGCWVPTVDLADAEQTVIDLYELERRTFCTTTPSELRHKSVCGSEGCLNARHYDLNYCTMSRNSASVQIDTQLYRTLADGSIVTAWGQELPSVPESLHAFERLRLNCYPYTSNGPLTPTPISQIRLHPLTGCWEAYNHERNTKGLANPKHGYGTLYQPPTKIVDKATGEIKTYRRGSKLAHRAIMEILDPMFDPSLDVDHLCLHKRCCNPLHLEQVPGAENQQRRLQVAESLREQGIDRSASIYTSAEQLRELYDDLMPLQASMTA